ncbi:acetyltransferase (GNAT) family protein [Aliiruegeria haliotis]|uniref:Acetyltransferase (GNAT) family protein n=2 Tax=Aliiruegeria haliotis TaxID=1280846 RepID=A0A2T0RM63_9RHOB|nr:acetyltransferase (GNAT) family protein [Aliiruegeria haliotis]
MVPGSWCLSVIATLPEYRSRGHAAVLMQQAETLARDGHHPTLALVVADENVGAIRLYQKCGFSEFARRPMVKGDLDGPGEDWILMVKPLSDN